MVTPATEERSYLQLPLNLPARHADSSPTHAPALSIPFEVQEPRSQPPEAFTRQPPLRPKFASPQRSVQGHLSLPFRCVLGAGAADEG